MMSRRLFGLFVAAVMVVSVAGCDALGGGLLEFTVGECVNLPDGNTVSEYETVECSEPHDAEVFGVHEVEGEDDEYPAFIASDAEERCDGDFEPYVGLPYEESAIFATSLTPSRESWESGDREIVCLLVGQPDGSGGNAQLTGSKKDSGE